jgi:hypothetical protein
VESALVVRRRAVYFADTFARVKINFIASSTATVVSPVGKGHGGGETGSGGDTDK